MRHDHLFIGGQWVESESGEVYTRRDPGDWQRRLAARPGDPRRSETRHHSGARGV